jgi:hypothetical protein
MQQSTTAVWRHGGRPRFGAAMNTITNNNDEVPPFTFVGCILSIWCVRMKAPLFFSCHCIQRKIMIPATIVASAFPRLILPSNAATSAPSASSPPGWLFVGQPPPPHFTTITSINEPIPVRIVVLFLCVVPLCTLLVVMVGITIRRFWQGLHQQRFTRGVIQSALSLLRSSSNEDNDYNWDWNEETRGNDKILGSIAVDMRFSRWNKVLSWIVFHPDELNCAKFAGQTALHLACFHQVPVHIIDMMLYQAPALAAAVNDTMDLPLHWAVKLLLIRDEVIQRLLATNPASACTAKDVFGSTALSIVWRRCGNILIYLTLGGDEISNNPHWQRVLFLLRAGPRRKWNRGTSRPRGRRRSRDSASDKRPCPTLSGATYSN